MKKIRRTTLVATLFLSLALGSCIQKEALNAEADIESCEVTPLDILRQEPKVSNNRISLMIKPSADLTNITLDFTLTPGATIEPANGTTRDFSDSKAHPVTYTVTSQDGNWKKTYTVICDTAKIRTKYDFEHYEIVEENKRKFYEFYEVLPDTYEKQHIWASGNRGFAIVGGDKTANEYPTTSNEFGKSGKCLKLETRSTGDLGNSVHMPIAAGNLFIGEFESKNAMTDALGATHFGLPFNFIPTKLTGYYKYKRGEVFTDENNSINPNKKDNFDFYAILYETDENVKYLDGRTFLSSPNLVSIARIQDSDKKETLKEWIPFDLPFVYQNGKTIDPQKLKEGKYNVAIVFSSSIEGDRFRGAVGSQLYIDEVELVNSEN